MALQKLDCFGLPYLQNLAGGLPLQVLTPAKQLILLPSCDVPDLAPHLLRTIHAATAHSLELFILVQATEMWHES